MLRRRRVSPRVSAALSYFDKGWVYRAPRLGTLCDGGWTRSGRHLAARAIAGLRQIHHQAVGFPYEVVADTLLRVTGDRREIRELARRAAFNILAGNRDDHAKNFSLLMDSNG